MHKFGHILYRPRADLLHNYELWRHPQSSVKTNNFSIQVWVLQYATDQFCKFIWVPETSGARNIFNEIFADLFR